MKNLSFLSVFTLILAGCGPEVQEEPGPFIEPATVSSVSADAGVDQVEGVAIVDGFLFGYDHIGPFSAEVTQFRTRGNSSNFKIDMILELEDHVKMVRFLNYAPLGIRDLATAPVEDIRVQAMYCTGEILDMWSYDTSTYDGSFTRNETDDVTRLFFELPFEDMDAPIYGYLDLEVD